MPDGVSRSSPAPSARRRLAGTSRGAAIAVAVLCLAAGLVAGQASAKPKNGGKKVSAEAIAILFDPDAPGEEKFGRLEWRGGLELIGGNRKFGGFSGLALSPDGLELTAVSDKGRWLTARVTYRGGRLADVTGMRLSSMRDRDGGKLKGKDRSDAEGLAPDPLVRGAFLVSFERDVRIWRYYPGGRKSRLKPEAIALPVSLVAGVTAQNDNKQLEAVGRFAGGALAGTIVTLREAPLDGSDRIEGWLIGGGLPGRFHIAQHGAYTISDLAILPGGDLVTLERKPNFLEGPAMVIRRIAQADIRPGALVDGEVLIEAGGRLNIDNMEGLAAHRDQSGETRLTVISDDNFKGRQRTLLLQFALPGK